jgi:hypothetical protein
MHLLLYPQEKRYPLERRMGGPQNQSKCCGEKRNLSLPGIEPKPSSSQPFTILTELS